jgi:hypothetical protein
MATDRDTLLAGIGGLLGDLKPSAPAVAADLTAAYLAAGRVLAGPHASTATMAAGSAATAALAVGRTNEPAIAAALGHAADQVLAERRSLPAPLVWRRSVPVRTARNAASLPAWAAGRAIGQSYGPFADELGRPVWLDLFPIVPGLRVTRAAGASPFLILPAGGAVGSMTKLTLGPGSVWIAARELADAAPAHGYTGLRVRRATLSFSKSVNRTASEIVVPAGTSARLTLQLDPPVPASGAGLGGADARATATSFPATLILVFGPAGATVTGSATARLDLYNQTVGMSYARAPPSYAADLGSILVPFKPAAASLVVGTWQSNLLTLSGKAAVVGAAWVLPVAVVTPDALGEASGVGALGVLVADGLAASWQGHPRPVPLGSALVTGAPGQLLVSASEARGIGTSQQARLSNGHGPATVRYPTKFGVLFVSESAGGEALTLNASLTLSAALPLTVQGQQVPASAKAAAITLWQNGPDLLFAAEGTVDPPRVGRKALAFSLINGVLISTSAQSFVVAGKYAAGALTDGGVLLSFGLTDFLPILPDPYCSNITFKLRGDENGKAGTTAAPVASMVSVVLWTAATPAALAFVLPPTTLLLPQAMAPTPSSLPHVSTQVQSILADDRRGEQALAGMVDRAVGSPAGGLMLLDLSSNVDQFGVRFGASAPTVDQLQLVLPGRQVRAVTLPAATWEPVVTLSDPNDPNFPSPMSFADSGGPTMLATETVELVPVAPQPVLEQLVNLFNDAINPQSVAALLTLPFGIKAAAQLAQSDSDGYQASLDFNRPQFPVLSLTGGFQVRIDALASPAIVPGGTPSLKGATLQLRNGLLSGVPTGKSVLGSADITFNSHLGPSAANPRVPLTRIDISGYGESLFSDWRNPDDGAGIVTKATFDVLVGRTSYELIQIQSIVYPYAVRVVRSIVLQRLNTGTVIRRDSGWKAVTEGRYAYPEPDLRTHPGVVLGVVNVSNIRETGQTYTTAAHTIMMAARFDCDVDIAGVELGATAAGVPARDQLGFVQMTAVVGRKAITPAELKEILDKFGPLCGQLDCRINIGGSGQKMRVMRVGAAPADAGSGPGPDFAMGAWGSPVMPRAGQWSFTRRQATTTAPQPVDQNLGVPLVRQGLAPNPPATAPYRFADPADVNKPGMPQTEYALLHASGTQRLLFRRPVIEAGTTSITAKPPTTADPPMPVLLADPYALATSHGIFPSVQSCIVVPDANWALQIDASGNLKLVIAQSSFSVVFGQREIVNTKSMHSYVQYHDEQGNVSTATITLDTAAAVPWRFQLSQVSFATASGKLGEVMRVVADIDASGVAPTQFKNGRIVLGGAFKPVQQILEFLSDLGIPSSMHVKMTNNWALKAGIKVALPDIPLEYIDIEDVDLSVSLTCQTQAGIELSEVELSVGGMILWIIPAIAPLKGVGLLEVAIAFDNYQSKIELTLGVGVGYEQEWPTIKPVLIKFKGYLVRTLFLITTDIAIGVGGGLILSLSADVLHFCEISIQVEAKVAIFSVSCFLQKDAIWSVERASIDIEVTTKFLMDFNYEIEWSDEQHLGGGSCQLPDII